MTSADNFFWTCSHALSHYQFTLINYIGFSDKGWLPTGGWGDTNGKPAIAATGYPQKAFDFGKNIY